MKQVVIGIISRKRDTCQEEFLLIQSRKDFGEFSGYYYPPGGHVEASESVSDALVREVKEELSLHITPLREVAMTPGDVKDQVTHWWLCEVNRGNITIKKDELSDATYVTEEEMETMKIWPATRKFFNTYIFRK